MHFSASQQYILSGIVLAFSWVLPIFIELNLKWSRVVALMASKTSIGEQTGFIHLPDSLLLRLIFMQDNR